jgi:hypothetical protein
MLAIVFAKIWVYQGREQERNSTFEYLSGHKNPNNQNYASWSQKDGILEPYPTYMEVSVLNQNAGCIRNGWQQNSYDVLLMTKKIC